MVFPNAWSECINQFIIEKGILRKVLELLDLLIIEQVLMIFLQKLILNTCLVITILHLLIFAILFLLLLLLHVDIEPFLVSSHKVDHIDVGSVNVLESTHVRVHSYSHCLVDTNCLHSITRLNIVDKILISTEMYCVRCLTLRNSFWGLLHLDMLLVREVTVVVNHLKSVRSLAVLAIVRIEDTSTLDELILLKATLLTLEACFLHFRNDIRVPDYNTLD